MRTLLITESDPHLLEKVEAACRGGIDAIQLRDKKSSALDLFHLAKKMREITWAHKVELYINTRADIALAVHADGVHFPESCSIQKFGSLRIGASVHSLEAAKNAEEKGADFLLYSSPEKGLLCLSSLRTVAQNTNRPVFALGKVTPEQISSILETGAHGVAALSAILHAPDVEKAARRFSFPRKKFSFRGIYGIVSTFETGLHAIELGVQALQFRSKATERLDTLSSFCKKAGIPFFVNDRADLAKNADATGVHLGQTDLPIQEARKILGPKKIIGATASNLKEAIDAQKQGADYIGLGHVFPTQSKIKLTLPIGLETVSQVKKALSIPLIAIGGIDETNAQKVFDAGADGVAVLSALPKVLTYAGLFMSNSPP